MKKSSFILLLFLTSCLAFPKSTLDHNHGEVSSSSQLGVTADIPTIKFVVDESLEPYFKAVVRDSLKDWADKTQCLQWFIVYEPNLNIKTIYDNSKKHSDNINYTIYFVAGIKTDYPDKTLGLDWDGHGTYINKNHSSLDYHTGFAFIDMYSINANSDRLVRHELGHAMGLDHNDSTDYAIMHSGQNTKHLSVIQPADVIQFKNHWECR